MSKEEVITGLDIGSTHIRVVVGQKNAPNDKLHILGVGEVPTEGVSKGIITSIEDAVSTISSALEKAERMTGIPIEHAFVNINGSHIISQEGHGVIAVAKADGEIREEDVARAIEAAQTVATPPNYEILHVIPRSFVVDNQRGVKDPVGMSGLRLEVNAQIIQGLSSQIKNLTKCVYRTGVDIDDLVLSILAASESVLSKRQKELGVALINMGGATTSLMVFEEGDVLHTKVLPIGAGHITNDIAIGLRTSIDIAEKVKLEHGTCLVDEVEKREEVDLSQVDSSEDGLVSRQHVAEIIEARLEEIFKLINQELQKIERAGLLPAGVVITGGGAKLPGLIEYAKRTFRLPASFGVAKDVISAIDRVNDPTFSTAVGLALWGSHLKTEKKGVRLPSFSSINEVTGKMKKWLQSLMP